MRNIATGRLGLIGFACVLVAATVSAQEGAIAGVVRDSSEAVLPGVRVEVTSPALIEKVRSTTTDGAGQYQITNLPIGRYTVTFTLDGFNKLERGDIELTTGFTANVAVAMTVGNRNETIVVTAPTPVVDVQNARQATTFSGEQLRDLPTARNISSVLASRPGSPAARTGTAASPASAAAAPACSAAPSSPTSTHTRRASTRLTG